jgi:hypothetical protein
VQPTGESGLLGNAHSSDQIDLYLEGRYHPSWLTRSDIEHHAEATLELKPYGDLGPPTDGLAGFLNCSLQFVPNLLWKIGCVS